MKLPRFLFFLISFFVILPVWFSKPGYAAEDKFTTAYSISYEVEVSGITDVTYQVGITNLTTQYYVSEYDLIIPSANIRGIGAVDRRGAIIPQITTGEDSTKIHLVFNDKVVGKGNTLSFAFTYKTPEIAQKSGRIWEINIPPETDNPDITVYNAQLKVPSSFGPLAYAFPVPSSGLKWTKEQLKSGAVLAFGDYQLFKFKLSYHLANSKLFPFYTEIALPSDNSYQTVRLDSIMPQPVSIRHDDDGNWMARYDLSPGEKIDIQASGFVKLSPFSNKNDAASEEKPSKFLADHKFWEVNDPEIQKLAQTLKTPQAIYDYVVSKLKYDYQRATEGGKRLGAKAILKSPENAICMEFTDLFVALSRAAGIPAREVDGFAYTTNSKLRPISQSKDILHAWPEFWDSEKKAWIMVDPTWGTTTGGIDYFHKLDFNHFALAIRGASSEMPIPAGGYKLDGTDGKDVEVEPVDGNWQDAKSFYSVSWNLPQWVVTGFGINGSLEIKNSGPTAVYGDQLIVTSQPEGLVQNQPVRLALAPGEIYNLNLEFKRQGWFENFNGVIGLKVGEEIFSKPFEAKSLGWFVLLPLVGFCSVIFIAVGVWKGWFRFRKTKNVKPETN